MQSVVLYVTIAMAPSVYDILFLNFWSEIEKKKKKTSLNYLKKKGKLKLELPPNN